MFVQKQAVNSSFKPYKMSKKELIIKLIQQDLKHSQLIYGLDKMGLDGADKHHLQLFDLVYALMKVPQEIEMEWGNTYQKYMKQALLVELSGTDASLKPLAVLCFRHLKMLVNGEIENLN